MLFFKGKHVILQLMNILICICSNINLPVYNEMQMKKTEKETR